ncbi:hypothetical protein CHH28_12905 [Bacterioplanes sanyensis]|uniref:Structural protein MipA n=1 Tax=Bacterioplanes sanyensis TaxID=1249553 RepID=A0A222FKE8_9GAMM|nr:MipA/OmpV family protein [Bacterioplanes sanyensis]ASP39517.1 hypothetical protein CHH28_12905 [Bacterioplanes sanyensis]
MKYRPLRYVSTATMALTIGSVSLPVHSEFRLGAGMANTSGEYKDSQGNVYALPVIQYQSELININIDRAEVYLPISQHSWLSALASLRLQTLNEDTSKATRGIEARKESLDAGVGIHSFDDAIGYLGLEWVHDISQQHKGHELSLIAAMPLEGPRLSITPSVFINQLSEELVDYYYGIRTSEVRSERPLYQGQATTNIGGSLDIHYRMTSRWRLQSETSITQLGSGISDSPIIDTKVRWNTMLSVSYQL